MRPVIRASRPKADPAPSRWSWRLQRLMLTPGFLFGLRVLLPLAALVFGIVLYFSDEDRRLAIVDAVSEVRASIQERPEFMVKLMAIDGASTDLSSQIRETVPYDFPTSSFDLDLPTLRTDVAALPGVKSASVRIRPGGVLQITVTPRVAVAVWRHQDGLTLIDAEGVRVKDIGRRADVAALPMMAGAGAPDAVTEALALVRVASVLDGRLRGLVRMGERRWDVVLDRGQRILLPEDGAVQALERVIALEQAQDVLSRDVLQVDMRLPQRPTLRMSENATEKWWNIQQIPSR